MLELAGLLGSFLILYVLLGSKIDSQNSIIVQTSVGLVLLALYFSFAAAIGVLPVSQGKRLLQREYWKRA